VVRGLISELRAGMISAKLLHMVNNRLQRILGYNELIEIETDAEKRAKLFEKVRKEVRNLEDLLKAKVQR
jgi:hypothetical protein